MTNQALAKSQNAEVLNDKDADHFLEQLSGKTIGTLKPPSTSLYLDYFGIRPMRYKHRLIRKLKAVGAKNILFINDQLTDSRLVKSAEELLLIAESVKITKEALRDIEDNLKEFKTELDLAAYFEYHIKKNHGSSTMFHTIVATGKNAATIHHHPSKTEINLESSTIIDCGAKLNNSYYGADISVSLTKTKDKLVLDAIDFIKEVKSKIETSVIIGQTYHEHESISLKIYQETLKKHPLAKHGVNYKDARSLVPHRFSHPLGIDTHDVELANTKFENGHVFTIEPGIYLPEHNLGVRIEDDYTFTNQSLLKL